MGKAWQVQLTAFQQQQGLAQFTVPSLYQQDIATLGTVGAQQQAQSQAEVRCRQRNDKNGCLYEPYERLGFLWSRT